MIVKDMIQVESNKIQRQKVREEKEFFKNNYLIIEKLDFNKRFFEPIIEERDTQDKPGKIIKAPRGLVGKV